MISLRVDAAANRNILQRARAKVEANTNRTFRAQVYRMFEDVLLVSPQFSGEYASNWRIVAESGEAGAAFTPWPGKGSVAVAQQPHQAGDPEAITFAREQAARVPFNFRQKVFFVNETPLEFTATTVTGAGGTQNLRPENIIPGGVRISSYLKAKYGSK
jgi:hypothetical protein